MRTRNTRGAAVAHFAVSSILRFVPCRSIPQAFAQLLSQEFTDQPLVALHGRPPPCSAHARGCQASWQYSSRWQVSASAMRLQQSDVALRFHHSAPRGRLSTISRNMPFQVRTQHLLNQKLQLQPGHRESYTVPQLPVVLSAHVSAIKWLITIDHVYLHLHNSRFPNPARQFAK